MRCAHAWKIPARFKLGETPVGTCELCGKVKDVKEILENYQNKMSRRKRELRKAGYVVAD